MPILARVSRLYLASVAKQASLSLTCSETPKTGFLFTWLMYPTFVLFYVSLFSITAMLLLMMRTGQCGTEIWTSVLSYRGKAGQEKLVGWLKVSPSSWCFFDFFVYCQWLYRSSVLSFWIVWKYIYLSVVRLGPLDVWGLDRSTAACRRRIGFLTVILLWNIARLRMLITYTSLPRSAEWISRAVGQALIWTSILYSP